MNKLTLCFASTCAVLLIAGCADADSDAAAPDTADASAAPTPSAEIAATPTATDPMASDATAVDLDELVGTDDVSHAMNCVVHLGQLGPGARVDPGLAEPAAAAWRGWLVGETSEQEAAQLIGSNVNMLSSTPEAARDVAAQWCIDNAPA